MNLERKAIKAIAHHTSSSLGRGNKREFAQKNARVKSNFLKIVSPYVIKIYRKIIYINAITALPPSRDENSGARTCARRRAIISALFSPGYATVRARALFAPFENPHLHRLKGNANSERTTHMKPKCYQCRFFGDVGQPTKHERHAEGGLAAMRGECRRRPPTVGLDPHDGLDHREGQWPLVPAGKWCGEFQPHDDTCEATMAAQRPSNRPGTEIAGEALVQRAVTILRRWRKKKGRNALMPEWELRRRLNRRRNDFKDIVQELQGRRLAQFATEPGATKPRSGYRLL